MKLFISHCSDDTEIMDIVHDSLDKIFDDSTEIFCTYKDSILAGKDRGPALARQLRECDTMIAIITDSYMRSVICISEISAFWAKNGKIIPIIYNGDTGIKFINKLFGQDIIYISSESKNSNDLVRWLNTCGISEHKAELAKKWLDAVQADPDNLPKDGFRAFISSEKYYDNFIHYCMKSGIRKIQNTPLEPRYIHENLVGKKQVYLVGTNNKGIIANHKETFKNILLNGGDLYVLIANRGSQFCRDVAEIESIPSGFDTFESFEKTAENENERLQTEFSLVKYHLRAIYTSALKENQDKHRTLGHLYFGCAFTAVRQTVIMGLDPDNFWSWVTFTMPPKRAANTISMEVSGKINNSNPDEKYSLIDDIRKYVLEICELAKKYNQFYEVTMNSFLPEYFAEYGNLDAAKWEWKKFYDNAQQNMKNHQNCSRELIEIAAQHPLVNGEKPDTVFKSRLDRGILLYEELKKEGKSPVIYIPGDLHIPDRRSLSSAGTEYILSTGRIPPEDLLGEDMNRKYKGEDGVYNSADECFTASQIFLDGDFRKLHCICSDSQAQRKKLFYWKFGVIPMIHTVPADIFHNDFDEAFDAVPNIIFSDHDWQSKKSKHYRRTRLQRKPDFK
ncbi:MAG TPA: hypothetical protein DCG30_06835 [Ruminococcus sp.]|nr:hypothetical protein [Ruminococcus sp.]